jgi:hypothetical protein
MRSRLESEPYAWVLSRVAISFASTFWWFWRDFETSLIEEMDDGCEKRRLRWSIAS